MNKPERKASSIRSKAALLFVSLLVAFLAGESILRLFHLAPELKVVEIANPDCAYQRSKNPLLGFELKSGYKNSSPDFIESYERTNAHGLRDAERSVEKPEGVRRLLLLGDSVVEGYGLQETATISSQLQSLYGEENQGTEVLNFGVSAYCTLAEIELLATKGVKFAPDTVVLVFVENDFDNFNREAFPLGQTIERPWFAEFLFKRTYFFRLAFLSLDLFHFRADADPVAWNLQAIRAAGGDNNVVLGLQRFRELADEHNFEPVVAIWPRFEQQDVVDPHPISNADQLIVEALAVEYGIPSFRLSKYFRQELANLKATRPGVQISPRLAFSQGDELHPSPNGAIVAAKGIHQRLSEGFEQRRFDFDHQATSVSADLKDAIRPITNDSPDYSRVYNRIGNQLLRSGKTDKAIERYQKALLESPDNAVTHNNLGIALERNKTPDAKQKAIEHYKKATELRSDFAEAHFNLGNALEATDSDEQRKSARQHFIKAIQIQPDFVQAHYRLSRSLSKEGRMKAAEAGFRHILELDSQHAPTLRTLAKELATQQRYAEARGLFERFVQLDSPDAETLAEALNNLGAICAQLGDRVAAEKYLEAAVEKNPNHPKAKENLRKLRENN